jgi:hypothetical protein
MIVTVKFENNEYLYEIPLKKILPFLKVTEEDIENAIKEAIKRI